MWEDVTGEWTGGAPAGRSNVITEPPSVCWAVSTAGGNVIIDHQHSLTNT